MNSSVMAVAGNSTVAISVDGDTCHVSGILDFDTARSALESVVPAIEKNASLSIDLGGVTRSNSAGLALMIEWLATARRSGHEVSFVDIPDGLSQLAVVCQVDGLLAGAA